MTLAEQIRRERPADRMSMIMLLTSGDAHRPLRAGAERLGISGHLIKPVMQIGVAEGIAYGLRLDRRGSDPPAVVV